VHPQDVVRNQTVTGFLDIVSYNKQKIEAGEEGIWECDIFVGVFVDVILLLMCQLKSD